MLHSFVSARRSQGKFLLQCPGTDDGKRLLDAARCFQRAGFFVCTRVRQHDRESTWKLTPEGKARLSVGVVLRQRS